MLRRLCCLCLITLTLQTAAPSPSPPVADGAGFSSLQRHRRRHHGSQAAPVFAGGRRRALWPGSPFSEGDRQRAVMRGLNFIYRTALKPRNFKDYGHDYLWCFYTLSEAVQDAQVRRAARRMGLERARLWRRVHQIVPADADAGLISELVFGDDAAESLGLKDEKFKEELRRAAPRFKARAYLLFDPLI